jgi:hypothetical protein
VELKVDNNKWKLTKIDESITSMLVLDSLIDNTSLEEGNCGLLVCFMKVK